MKLTASIKESKEEEREIKRRVSKSHDREKVREMLNGAIVREI